MKRDFLSLADLGPGGIEPLLDVAKRLAESRKAPDQPKPLAGRSAALVFEKASTRTRVSLELAVHELGGYPLVLTSQGSQMARGEPIADTARVLDRMVDVITFRTSGRDRLLEMAKAVKVPVINALTDDDHPLQLLADLYTVRTVRGRLSGLRYVWIGDGNNMARSWIEAARLLGLDLVLACPAGYEPPSRESRSRLSRGSEGDRGRRSSPSLREGRRHQHRRVGQHGAGRGARAPPAGFPGIFGVSRATGRRRRRRTWWCSIVFRPIVVKRSTTTSSRDPAPSSGTKPRRACTPRKAVLSWVLGLR